MAAPQRPGTGKKKKKKKAGEETRERRVLDVRVTASALEMKCLLISSSAFLFSLCDAVWCQEALGHRVQV